MLIIGILAAVALPQYTRAVAKSRVSEALLMGKAIRESAQRYQLETGSYPEKFEQLDIDVPGTNTGSDSAATDRIENVNFIYGLAYYDRVRASGNKEPLISLQIQFEYAGAVRCYARKGGDSYSTQAALCKSFNGTRTPTLDTANHEAYTLNI